jgi:hypothetical protein
MADIHFEDNTIEVKSAMNNAVIEFLYEAAGELASQVKRNTAVDTGKTKNSWTFHVSTTDQTATVGSGDENSIWEEFGTGEYALNGNGRKTPWRYKDRFGQWHTTTGKPPKRAFWKACETIKPKLQKALESKLKGLGK